MQVITSMKMVSYYSAALAHIVLSTTLTVSEIQKRTYTVGVDKDNPTEVDRKYDFAAMSVVNLSLICQLGVIAPSTPLIASISFFFFFYYCALAWPWQSMTGGSNQAWFLILWAWCVFEKKYSTCHRCTWYTTWMTWNTVYFVKKKNNHHHLLREPWLQPSNIRKLLSVKLHHRLQCVSHKTGSYFLTYGLYFLHPGERISMALVYFKCLMYCVYVDIIHDQPIHVISKVTCLVCTF